METLLYLEYFRVLLLTFVIEGAAILVLCRHKKYVYYSLLCNLLTNPAMNLLLALSLKLFGSGAYYPALVILELVVVFIEAVVYHYICGFGMKKAMMLSLFLNALSAAAGILMALWG